MISIIIKIIIIVIIIIKNTSLTAGAAADKAAVSKTAKYEKLRGTHLFFPVAIVTGGPWNTLVLHSSNRDGWTMEHTCSSQQQSRRVDHGTHLFFPVAIETGGPWNAQAMELIQEIGRRLTIITSDPLKTQYLFQRISITSQRGNNAVAFQNTFPTERSCSEFT